MITVSNQLSLRLYLQMRDLLGGLQSEIDHSTAVLDEAYGYRTDLGLDELSLAIRRIYSNLTSRAFLDRLRYVPEKTGFSADPRIITLLVEPLYGNYPGVGIRELIQNSTDAVRELRYWCQRRQMDEEIVDLRKQDSDVLIQYRKQDSGKWRIEVSDRGIGMKRETIQNYFLRAGASFRNSVEWSKEFVDSNNKPAITLSGRFGIGAFAIFLLGDNFEVWTRHVGDAVGYHFSASTNGELIEVERHDGLPIGTLVEIEVSEQKFERLNLSLSHDDEFDLKHLFNKVNWYCWDWPVVEQRVVGHGEPRIIDSDRVRVPIGREQKLPPEWSEVVLPEFKRTVWTYAKVPQLSVNGIEIRDPSRIAISTSWWSENSEFRCPNIAIQNDESVFPLTVQVRPVAIGL